jgi:hypothetical protein
MLGGVGALATEPDSTRAETGEQRLLAAVLHVALDDARKGRRDAREWLASDEPGRSATGWSYVDVCALLGLSPSWGRAQVALRVRPRGRRMGRRYLRVGVRRAAA